MWNVMCNVSKIEIDVDNRCGKLHLPEMNYPDMGSVIRCFKSVDPEITLIMTIVGGVEDTVYVCEDGDWIACRKVESTSCPT